MFKALMKVLKCVIRHVLILESTLNGLKEHLKYWLLLWAEICIDIFILIQHLGMVIIVFVSYSKRIWVSSISQRKIGHTLQFMYCFS